MKLTAGLVECAGALCLLHGERKKNPQVKLLNTYTKSDLWAQVQAGGATAGRPQR